MFVKWDLECAALNVYRSFLSAYHPTSYGFKVGQHPLVKDLLRRAFNTRPPKPRYTDTWDVNVVLNEIEKWADNESLSLSDLTHKLAILMALISASRCHELTCLELSYMQNFGNKIVFPIAPHTKPKNWGNHSNQSHWPLLMIQIASWVWLNVWETMWKELNH